MINVETLLSNLNARGIRVAIKNGDTLIVEPAPKLTDEDRAALRAKKADIIACLQIARAPDAPAEPTRMPDFSETILFDLAVISDAIAAGGSRSPIENDLSMARFARVAVTVTQIIYNDMGPAQQAVAIMEASRAAHLAARSIRDRDYLRAYELCDALIEQLKSKRFH